MRFVYDSLLGFDPFAKLADWLEVESEITAAV